MKPPGTFPRFVIGIDLGATNCRAALFSPEGEMGNRLERRFSPAGERDKEEKALLQLLDDLLEGERKERLLAVGIGSFGPLDLERNRILEAPNRPAWQNVPLRSLVEKHLSVPVFLENDGNVAALGEYRRGAGKGARSVLGITLGTGIGGGFVLDGQIQIGAHGMAAEVGHIYVGGRGIRCACGAVDCLEVYASGEGIKRQYRDRSGFPKEISCHAIFHLAREGDETARATIEESALFLGRGIASLQKTLDPETIVIGGGLSREWDLLVGPAVKEALDNVFPSVRESLRIVPASLGVDAGLVGAAELAITSLSP